MQNLLRVLRPFEVMANPLTLSFTFLILTVVLSANADPCKGVYTTNEREIMKGIDEDTSTLATGLKVLEGMVLYFKDEYLKICEETNRDEKLSLCMKVLQHKLKRSRPVSFTVNPTETSLECRRINYYNSKHKSVEQEMYDCPTTTVKFKDNSHVEPSFIIGQGLHATQLRIRVFAVTRTSSAGKVYAEPLAQFTGFDMKAVSFKRAPDGRLTYTPDYDDSGASGSGSRNVSSREAGRRAHSTMNDIDEPLLRYHKG